MTPAETNPQEPHLQLQQHVIETTCSKIDNCYVLWTKAGCQKADLGPLLQALIQPSAHGLERWDTEIFPTYADKITEIAIVYFRDWEPECAYCTMVNGIAQLVIKPVVAKRLLQEPEGATYLVASVLSAVQYYQLDPFTFSPGVDAFIAEFITSDPQVFAEEQSYESMLHLLGGERCLSLFTEYRNMARLHFGDFVKMAGLLPFTARLAAQYRGESFTENKSMPLPEL